MVQNLFHCVVCGIFCKYAVMKHEDEHVFCKHLANTSFFCLCSDSKYISNKSAKAKLFVISSLYALPLYLTHGNERKQILFQGELKNKNLMFWLNSVIWYMTSLFSYKKTSVQLTMVDRGIRIFCNFCSYQIIQVII